MSFAVFLESWLPVKGYEGRYEVSSYGRVRSLPRVIVVPGQMMGHQIRRRKGKPRSVSVQLRRDGKGKPVFLHKVVLEAFVGTCPKGLECCHNDGNPLNNHLDNLRWDTRLSNARDKAIHKTEHLGERRHGAKLRTVDIPVIRVLLATGHSLAAIGRLFDVGHGPIKNIRDGRNWKHVA